MVSELQIYVRSLLSNWAGLFSAGSLIVDAAGFVLKKSQILAIGDWLDRWVVEETRIRILRASLIAGFLIAGFIAWDEQYQIAISKAPQTLTARVATLQSQLDAVRDEIWIPLNAKASADLTSSFKAANISGLTVSVVRSDTPDCARIANQVVISLLAAGAVVPEPPSHTFDGEGSGITIFADAVAQTKGTPIQAALSKVFDVPIELTKQKEPWTVNGKSVDLGIMIGLRVAL
jgi:outer membrane murein-binding lipoprotein Lpp